MKASGMAFYSWHCYHHACLNSVVVTNPCMEHIMAYVLWQHHLVDGGWLKALDPLLSYPCAACWRCEVWCEIWNRDRQLRHSFNLDASEALTDHMAIWWKESGSTTTLCLHTSWFPQISVAIRKCRLYQTVFSSVARLFDQYDQEVRCRGLMRMTEADQLGHASQSMSLYISHVMQMLHRRDHH